MKLLKRAAGYALLWMGVAILADLILVPLDTLMQHEPFLVHWLGSLMNSGQPLLQIAGTAIICWALITLLLLTIFRIQKARFKRLQ